MVDLESEVTYLDIPGGQSIALAGQWRDSYPNQIYLWNIVNKNYSMSKTKIDQLSKSNMESEIGLSDSSHCPLNIDSLF